MSHTIADIRAVLGISILLVEHDMGLVMRLADEVTVLDFGRRIAAGTPDEVQRNPEVIGPTSAPRQLARKPREHRSCRWPSTGWRSAPCTR